MRVRISAAVVVALALCLTLAQPASADDGLFAAGLSGDLPDSGVALLLWDGGTVIDLGSTEPRVASLWVSEAGSLVGYLVGAPGFVNAAFLAGYPGGQVPGRTPVLVTVRASGGPTAPPLNGNLAAVVSVTDGDTLNARIGGVVEAVRLIGINTPEQGECFAAEATARLSLLVAGGEVRLDRDGSDRDQFGRLLRYVYVGDTLVNDVMVREGYALAVRYEPDTAMAAQLASAQAAAAAAGRGLWASNACGSAAAGSIEVAFIHYDAAGDDNQNKNDEWVDLQNTGGATLDLTGWSVKDESASHRYYFPAGFTLAPNATVRLYTGCGADSAAALYWCFGQSAIWNNGGDTVFVIDPAGNVSVSQTYAGN
ncbi:MAG: lamin tail domain-containing protein [Chloroflexi bacterium]|nr:lamin tail domain-containing protein [Chloroflexota bacterium]